jgi:hypothetical protein
VLTFGDALCRALAEYLDKSQRRMAERVVRSQGQGFGQLPFGRGKGRVAIGHKEKCSFGRVRARRSNERLGIVGIGGERAVEKAARLRNEIRGRTLIAPGQTLKIEVHRVGIRDLLRPSRFGGDELGIQRARQARDDFVLHVEEIGEGLVEPLGAPVSLMFAGLYTAASPARN